ncbi:MAG: sigma-70 family RNA polymerase sigma factor [Bacteroidales bacterium]|nr:sigma-70 family RNA polymerase sigma factor [Bacteroidales bacterium]
MIKIKDSDLLKGIEIQDVKTLRHIYQEYFPMIRHMVTTQSGQLEDSEDIFQDAIIIIYNKIKEGHFNLTSSFKTFLYSVCRNIWLQQLNKNKAVLANINTNDFDMFDLYEENNDEQQLQYQLENHKYNLYQRHFLTLSEDCQKVLSMFLKKISLKDIAETMGYKTEKYAKTRKFLCKESLKKNILDDPKCKITYNEH